MTPSGLAARLRATFLTELDEQLRVMNDDVIALERQPDDRERLKSLFRVAHTLKGAARAAGVPTIEQTCHELESLLARARDGKLRLAPEHFGLLYAAADTLADGGRRLRLGEDLGGSKIAELPAPRPRPAETPIRVAPEKLDALLASCGQLLAVRGRAHSAVAALEELHAMAASVASAWRREGRRLRVALERSGEMPAANALSAIDERLQRLVRGSERVVAAAVEQTRTISGTTHELLTGIRELRMRPFADACEALPRAVRDLAAASHKEVGLTVLGGEVQADRAVLDGLRETLLHAVRNAVDHGIETPEARARAGKPRQGSITIAAALRESRIVVTVSDDGAGLDVSAIRAQMQRRGMAVPASDADVARALFHGGISTRADATAISGRGVGLDLVRDALERIRGSVSVQWQPGRGTTFVLECPPTLASVRVILVEAGAQTLAIPTTHVQRLLRVAPEDIRKVEGRDVLAGEETPVPIVSLARLLPPLPEKPATGVLQVVLLRADGRRLAVVVDVLIAEQEIMLQPLKRQIGGGPPRRVSAATVLGTGGVALVLDVPQIIAAGLEREAGGITVAAPESPATMRQRILVVDDSITTRALEQSVLEAAGYDVLTAADGADAWRILQERGADLVLTDVEMPRMDGFGLCEAIRSSPRFKTLPIILMTALETPEHRARGLEVGADAYLGKSSFDQQGLIETVRQLLGWTES